MSVCLEQRLRSPGMVVLIHSGFPWSAAHKARERPGTLKPLNQTNWSTSSVIFLILFKSILSFSLEVRFLNTYFLLYNKKILEYNTKCLHFSFLVFLLCFLVLIWNDWVTTWEKKTNLYKCRVVFEVMLSVYSYCFFLQRTTTLVRIVNLLLAIQGTALILGAR